MIKTMIAALLFAAQAGAQDFMPAASAAGIKDLIAAGEAPGIPPAPAPSAADPAAAPKEWTIMVFMNGKNDLTGQVPLDINEMEASGPPAGVNVIVEAGRSAPPLPQFLNYPGPGPSAWPGVGGVVPHPGFPDPVWKTKSRGSGNPEDWTGVRRYEISRDQDRNVIGSRLLETLDGSDMGSWEHLRDFALWAKSRYPAKRYMLIVWNHGSGWKPKKARPAKPLKAISSDQETGNVIDIPELGAALGAMGGVDLYASDACLMQMAEVVYQLKDHAPVIVGSEENEPATGWTYDYFLSGMRALGSGATPEAVAAAAVRGYNRYYAETASGFPDSTMSAVRAGRLGAFRAMLDGWAELAMRTGDRQALLKAAAGAKAFKGADSRDLVHFLKLAGASSSSPELAQKSRELTDYLSSEIIFGNAVTGAQYAEAKGLGIYLPAGPARPEYQELSWARDGKWDEFLRWLAP